MYYVTGDVHGGQEMWHEKITPFLKPGDTILVAGDFGVGFFDGRHWPEEMFYDYLAEQPYTVLFCDGNHENFEKLNRYPVTEWHTGNVHRIRENVIHLMRGEIYRLQEKSLFVMGGGFSLDKPYRTPGKSWWPEEMPAEAEYENAREHLKDMDYAVDYILTHTAPFDTVEYMATLGRRQVQKNVPEEYPLTEFLQWVQEHVQYRKWYFGHFHLDEELWREQYVLLGAIRELDSGKLVKMTDRSI